jgi:hypothetical protein
MHPFFSPHVTSELIADLDAQLMRLQCCACHVAAGPVLVGIGWSNQSVMPLEHYELDSYLQAEMIAQRVNALQGATDSERTHIVRALLGAA